MATRVLLPVVLVISMACSVAAGRRGASTMRTIGSLKVEGGRGNRAGNDEEELTLDTANDIEVLGDAADSSTCVSEGGDAECADCATSGNPLGLPCRSAGGTSFDNPDCDSLTAVPPNIFLCWGAGTCACNNIGDGGGHGETPQLRSSATTGSPWITKKFPGFNGTVITKMFMAHPSWAETNVGVLAVKRVAHRWSPKLNATVADIMKKGICVVCPAGIVPWTAVTPGNDVNMNCGDETHERVKALIEQGRNKGLGVSCNDRAMYLWYSGCLLKALTDKDGNGDIKDEYRCKGQLQADTTLRVDKNGQISSATAPALKAFEDFMVAL